MKYQGIVGRKKRRKNQDINDYFITPQNSPMGFHLSDAVQMSTPFSYVPLDGVSFPPLWMKPTRECM